MTNDSSFTSPCTRGIALSLVLLAASCGGSDAGTGTTENGVGTGSGGAGTGACAAGSVVQGGGSDTCPNLPWRCVDETVGNPRFHLVGTECGPGHTGACCNYTDKCLMIADGTASSQSAVEAASVPCQAGCVVNPSAQACLDCINANLTSSGLSPLSSGCGTCFSSLITCSSTNCLAQCLASSTAPGCRECVFNNCTIGAGKYNECTGMLSNAGTKK